MDERPSYRGIKSDYYTHCHDLPPQIGRCLFLPEAEPFTAEIDGGAWSVTMVRVWNDIQQHIQATPVQASLFVLFFLISTTLFHNVISQYIHHSSSPPSLLFP